MKRTITVASALLLLAGTIFAHTLAAAFGWTSTTQELGRIRQGNPVTVTYAYTNTGTTPLLITHAKGSCGCTGVEWTKEAVMPGATGRVKATFNAAAVGTFSKSVFVESNAGEGLVTLQFKGEVVADDDKSVGK